MTRHAILVISFVLGVALGAGNPGFASKSESGLDERAPTPRSPTCFEKAASLPRGNRCTGSLRLRRAIHPRATASQNAPRVDGIRHRVPVFALAAAPSSRGETHLCRGSLAILDRTPRPAEVAVLIQFVDRLFAPRLIDLRLRLGRAPPV
jgi:hypothetical protein